MSEMTLRNYIRKLKELVQIERDAEIRAMQREMRLLSGEQRERIGRAILNLNGKIIGEEFGFILVRYGRKREFKTEISTGDLVVISKGDPLKSDLIGTVVERGKCYITISVENIPRWALRDARLDLHASDITFRRQLENLENLNRRGKNVLKLMLGIEKPSESKRVNFSPEDRKLNSSQIEAIEYSLGSDDFFLIHGPFGTGKTRTVAELVIQEVKRGNRVLAVAESNVAVDNIAELLNNIKVVRLGHPSRVSRELRKSTLASLVESHAEYRKVRIHRMQAEKLSRKRDLFTKPVPALRRGLSNEEILEAAKKGISLRGLSHDRIKSLAGWIGLDKEVQSHYRLSKEIEKEIIRDVIEDSDVVLTTNSSSALEFLQDFEFDVAVVDEASQATIPSILIPLSKAERFILAGDHKQLPPTVLVSKELQETLFEKLITRYPQKSKMLRVQYRMNSLLMEFPANEFYDGKISVGNSERPTPDCSPFKSPLIFIDTSGSERRLEKQRKGSESRENPYEAEIVEKVLHEILKFVRESDVGIITPYDDQVELIRSRLKNDVEVNTVDGYQGREKDVVILSLVRSNRQRNLGFLTDLRRLNVSLTRAKKMLIVVGDSSTLKANETYNRFIEFVRRKGMLIDSEKIFEIENRETDYCTI